MFDGIIDLYRNRYAKLKELDQRLIKPDTANDAKFEMSRAQVFAHGEAYVFLSALRAAADPKIFDEAVRRYLNRGPGSPGGYELFVDHLPKEKLLARERIEHEFGIR